MKEVNVTQLRNRLQAYLAIAAKGEELFITNRGKLIAKIIPAEKSSKKAAALLKKLRTRAKIYDVISPINEKWDAD